MATKKYLDKDGFQYFWGKIKNWVTSRGYITSSGSITGNAATATRLAGPKHSYTTTANAAKNWYRIANANTHQMDTSKPLQIQFMLTAWNPDQPADYYEQWFVDCQVYGRNSGMRIFGASGAPFSQARVLYENTVASIDSSDRPAIDIYLNYVLATACQIRIEEIYNSGWAFPADGVLAASTIPSGFENRAVGVYGSGVQFASACDYAGRTRLQRSNITANATLANNDTYRSRVLNCTNAITITVPSLNSDYAWFLIKNFNAASTNKNVTIHPSTTSVLIDDSNADIVLKPGEWVIIASKAANSYSLIADGRWKSQKMTRGVYERIEGSSSTHKDLNNYIDAGFYNVKTQYVDNCPTNIGIDAVLLVYPWNFGSYCTQEITESAASGDTRRWIRKLNSTTWSAWKQVAFTNTTLAGYGITDAKIADGTITLGSSSITPLTSVPSHNQASNTINAMTGYSKPNSASAIATTDTLNQAIGKLEKAIDDADISNTMHVNGDETISGVKTFTSQIVKSTSEYILDYDVGSSYIEPGVLLYKNTVHNIDLAYLFFGRYSDGTNAFRLRTKNSDGSIWGDLGVYCTPDGLVYAAVVSGSGGNVLPPDSEDSGMLATTKWVRRYCETTKGYITSSDSITGNAATVTGTAGTSALSWNTEVTLATIGGNAVKAKLPANPNTNTTYTFATGDSNGQIKVTPSNGSAQNIDVKGLGSAAFTEAASYLSRSSNNSVTSFHFFHREVANSGICFGGGDGTTNGAYVSLYGQTASNAGKVLIHAKSSSADSELALVPGGTASWKGQAIQTSSDERIKTTISNVSDDILDAWEDVQWGEFKFLDAIEEKGDKARYHIGLIAQAVSRVFEKHGADILKYGILCHEKQDAAENEPAVDLWMVRYTEALCMEAAYQRRRADRLEARIATLEEKLNG